MDNGLFDLRALIGLLIRQRRVGIITFALTLVLATTLIFALQPYYTASSMVLVDPSSKNLLEAGIPRGDVSDSSRVDSEVLIAQSLDVLEAVSTDLDLGEKKEYEFQPGPMERILLALKLREPRELSAEQRAEAVVVQLAENVSVRRVDFTFVLSINAVSSDPALATSIANAVAQTYIDLQVRRKVSTMTASRDVIEARIAEASSAIQRSEDEVDAYTAAQVELISKSSGDNNIEALKAQIDQAVAARDRYDRMLGQLNSGLVNQDWVALSSVIQSPQFRSMNAKREELQASLASQASDAGAVIDLRAELDELQAKLIAEAGNEVNSLSSRISASQEQAATVRNQLREAIISADLPTSIMGEIYQLQQAAEIARQQYQVLLARLNELNTQAYLQVADSSIVSRATTPAAPSFPSTRLFLLVAAVFATGLAVGAAFVVDSYVGGFTSPAQVEAVLRTEVVSSVPRQKPPKRTSEGGESLTIADLVLDAPLSTFTEAIRRVRLGIERVTRGLDPEAGKGVVILVTSAAPGEGKTSISLSIARSYAVAGKRCLLVDCDLRKPSLHKHLGLHRDSGLMEFLSGEDPDVTFDSIVDRDPRIGVHIVVGSQRSSTATDHFVRGASFSRLVNSARKVFDVVVLDAPPIMPVVDSLYLAPFADAIVFVSKWASTSQADAKGSVRLLDDERRPDVEILAVLNQVESVDARRSKYMDYYQEPAQGVV